MLFTGDIAIPIPSCIKVEKLPDSFKEEFWLGNLEGSLIKNGGGRLAENVVLNDIDAIKKLTVDIHFKAFSIANNHILDAAPIDTTLENLESIGMLHVGAGRDLKEASKYLDIKDKDGTEYTILSFGWDCIKCKYATEKEGGVNPYTRSHVLESVKACLDKGSKHVVCLFHWNYELELYPSPYDRQLAKQLIDMGVEVVIGCHAHRVQQIEVYKGKPIVYGLGNFLFPHNIFWNGRLKFPPFTSRELVVELKGDSVFAHWFDFDAENNLLTYSGCDKIDEGGMFDCEAAYKGMDGKEYDNFFAKNRYHKKLLPVFRSNELEITYWLKAQWVKKRGKLIDFLVKHNFKAKKK